MPRAKKPTAADAKPAKAAPAKKAKAEPVVEAAPVVETPEAEPSSAAASLQADFTGFMTKLQQASTLMSELKQSFRALEKKAGRELRAAEKASQKRKRKAGNRSPSGFVKPTLISNELAAFLGKTQGTEMARTEVTREINAYIRKQGLQDKDNGRKINADKKLAGLLKLKAGEELTYFNLQKYMSPHFAKATKAVDTA
tara:strand:- start:7841 stop:8434 length:594 start_codon:yes stop_codon:yes gene_type:complete